MPDSTNLNVTGIAVQTLYNKYLKNKIVVNRKYQRKVVWTINEKAKFIDSLIHNYPVPLILMAEVGKNDEMEIIDGLQRLNAVFSFIDGDFSLNGKYFDPSTLAETLNKSPVAPEDLLDNESCWKLVSYVLPISTYIVENEHDVEEVFRRINSNGRHLSKQEIRQAGSLSPIANLVRKISAAIRNDFSVGDKVNLQDMPKISLTDSPTSEGIQLSDVFWVRHGILSKEQLRGSRDEEIVLDLIISMVQGRGQSYRSDIFDEYYNSEIDSERRDSFNAKLIQYEDSTEYFISRFRKIIEIFEKIFTDELGRFSNHFFSSTMSRAPRYFETIFLAIDRLYFGNSPKEIIDWDETKNKMKGFGTRSLNIPGGGGSWTGESKDDNVDLIFGVINQYSAPIEGHNDPLLEQSHLEIINLLQASQIEQPLFELKQGFCVLSDPPKKNNDIIREIGMTLTAMANKQPNTKGYLLVGVSDSPSDTARIKQLLGAQEDFPIVGGREICGLDIDTQIHGGIEPLYMWFTNKFRDLPVEPAHFKDQILNDMKIASLGGKTLLLLKAKSQDKPISFNGKFYTRNGSRTDEIAVVDYQNLFSRFS